jgi:hypothetical protein
MRDAELWNVILSAPLDVVGPKSLLQLVQSETYLSQQRAEVALEEYRKFLYLRAATGEELAPSTIVDLIWRTHWKNRNLRPDGLSDRLEWPPVYRPKSGKFFGTSAYALTLQRYGEEFSTRPPSKAWPSVRFIRWQLVGIFANIAGFLSLFLAVKVGGAWENAAAAGMIMIFVTTPWLIISAPWGQQGD